MRYFPQRDRDNINIMNYPGLNWSSDYVCKKLGLEFLRKENSHEE